MADTNIQAMPSSRRALITVGLMAATLMQVLDQTIANVALPHMQAAMGATQESIAWVLTSYIIASAICLPLTGWLTGRFGPRRLFLIATAGFTVASMACGLATSLVEIIAFRLLQGAFGAFLVPLSQAVMFDIYPKEKHAQAMTIWAMGVMVGPIAGPTLGGWLTDAFDWRYVFFVNLPFGIMAFFLTSMMPKGERQGRKFDLTGFILIGIALAALQLMLDRGSQLDWFDSWEIRIELGIALAAFWIFGIHTATAREPIFNPLLFKDLNFAVSLIYILIVSGMVVAGSALLAPMLQRLLGYSATDAGLVAMPRGIATLFSLQLAGWLLKYVDGRWIISCGLVLTAISMHMMAGFNLDMDRSPIIISGLVQGMGFGLTFMPLNIMAFATLSSNIRPDGTAMYSLTRALGGSIAISITSAILVRNVQVSHSDLGQNITVNLYLWLQKFAPDTIGQTMLQVLDLEINRQALMIAYVDNFYLMFWSTIAVIPLIVLMRKSQKPESATEAMAMME